ncbi:MAG: DNA polymerase III subunit gamma/tau [Spirochaetia bacterium]|jgi:DNA polymerase-3 subunit gamma/tau|nr:DNA polymerase III subunit gamma/tau [Spirochaetia bacterium]
MSYEVTATRKRPQTFEQLAGQQFVAATLEKSIETGRIAHAYLFSGPRGCGKTSTARILAKALNCENGPTAQPCGICDSCKSIAAGSSLDVIEIDGASNTSVENVRQIKDEVLFPPNSSRYKIYIIDEVHMLSTSAFNALLKTIEEPPPYVVFMFATTEPHKVPATIKSRCQQFSFRLVQPEILVELLQSAASDIGVAAEPEALLWIARESGGSVRDAYTLFDQIASFSEGNITAALIREKLGLVGQDRMNGLFGRFIAGDGAGALADLEEILSSGVSPEQFVSDTVEYCRALLLLKNGITRESLLGAPLSSFDLAIGETLSGEMIEKLFSMFLATYRSLKESIDPRYELDLVVAKASHILDYIQPSELARSVGRLKAYLERGSASGGSAAGSARTGGSPSPSAKPSSRSTSLGRQFEAGAETTPAAQHRATTQVEVYAQSHAQVQTQTQDQVQGQPGVIAQNDVEGLKKSLVAHIRKSNVMLGAALEKSRSWLLEQGKLSILVASRMEADMLEKFSGIIAELLSQRLGSACRFEVGLTGEGQAADVQRRTAAAAQVRPTAFRESSGADSMPGRAAAGSQDPAAAPAGNFAANGDSLPPKAAEAGPILTQKEEESIALVERLFKGKLQGFAEIPKGAEITDAEP